MRYLTFSAAEHTSYEICLLVPQLNRAEMERHYLKPHLPGEESAVLAYDLYKEGKKTKAATIREYLGELLPTLSDLQVKYLVVCDAEYFKVLAKVPKVDAVGGYVLDAAEEFGEFKVIYCPNFRSVFYDPEKTGAKIAQAFRALNDHRKGGYDAPGADVIHFAAYPRSYDEIRSWLQRLLDMDCDLAIDIEGFSLKHYSSGIGTISFAWSKNEGIAFPVDYRPIPGATSAPFGEQVRNEPVRALLKEFFTLYMRRQIWHNISYDVYVLIFQLFMNDLLDTEGLLEGLEIMLRNWEDTKLITYLATNSCAGNQLGLKTQAQEFAGNYAQDDIEDITKIPLEELLQYNLVDSLSTWFVYEKHWDTMVADEQSEIYETLFKPGIVDIIQMQLTGLPLNMDRVKEVQSVLQDISDDAVSRMQSIQLVQEFVYDQTREAWEKDYQDRKGKAKNPGKIQRKEFANFPEKPFNPNSGPQLQKLLFDEAYFGLPVLDLTDTKQPATGGDTLEKLLNHTDDPKILQMLNALIEYKAIDKVLTSFLPSFLEAPQAPDGWHYLFGYFNLGGTLSGRLSSSNPNLQNLPANVFVIIAQALLEKHAAVLGPYVKKGKLALGKLIKSCFMAPPGWLFCGLDFASLEDRISALTTKDPNKLKVYTDGYDGHSLRALSYFEEDMPDIDPGSVESVNSIADLYPDKRQDSKAPTFALTYQGTFSTLMANCGFSEALAKRIEQRYHELYRVSDEWVAAQLDQASRDGYVTVAFGLRVRTPLLAQVIRGTSRTPREAEAEGRTAGNALGQSWCLLNTRAGIEFNSKMRKSRFRLTIRPCAHIHDAQYFLIREDMETILYLNKHLVKAVQWQEHPLIQHDKVKLGGELSIFYPTWAEELEIANDATAPEIEKLAAAHYQKYCAA